MQTVADWLEEQTAPVLVSLGEAEPAKKLLKAMRNKTPLLVYINKGLPSDVKEQLAVLEKFCEGKKEMVCGYVHSNEPDYE